MGCSERVIYSGRVFVEGKGLEVEYRESKSIIGVERVLKTPEATYIARGKRGLDLKEVRASEGEHIFPGKEKEVDVLRIGSYFIPYLFLPVMTAEELGSRIMKNNFSSYSGKNGELEWQERYSDVLEAVGTARKRQD